MLRHVSALTVGLLQGVCRFLIMCSWWFNLRVRGRQFTYMNQIMIIGTNNPNYYNQYSSNPVQNKLNYLLMCLSCPNAPLSVVSKRSTVCRVQTLHCLSCPNAPLSAVSKRSTFGVSATAVSPAIKFLVSCVRVENTRNTVTVGTLTIEWKKNRCATS